MPADPMTLPEPAFSLPQGSKLSGQWSDDPDRPRPMTHFYTAEQMRAAILAERERCAADARDAARYRWLRAEENSIEEVIADKHLYRFGADLDAAIDAAMADSTSPPAGTEAVAAGKDLAGSGISTEAEAIAMLSELVAVYEAGRSTAETEAGFYAWERSMLDTLGRARTVLAASKDGAAGLRVGGSSISTEGKDAASAGAPGVKGGSDADA